MRLGWLNLQYHWAWATSAVLLEGIPALATQRHFKSTIVIVVIMHGAVAHTPLVFRLVGFSGPRSRGLHFWYVSIEGVLQTVAQLGQNGISATDLLNSKGSQCAS
jgi:hypothetical protein